jgi:hypothetical protein
LPVHASWRDDPTSSVAIDVLDAVFDYIGVPKTGAKAPRKRTKNG